jgi:hypothetical protein
MLKPLTLSLSLAVALGFCSVSMAGILDHGSGCGLASPQCGAIASPQAPCYGSCGGGARHHLFSGLGCHFSGMHCRLKAALHPPVCYEWVLKKKRLWGHGGGCCGGGETCGGVYPTGQIVPSGQGVYGAPQGGYSAPQAAPVYGAGQHTYKATKPTTSVASAPAEMTPAVASEEAPPAPEVNQSGLSLPTTPSGN